MQSGHLVYVFMLCISSLYFFVLSIFDVKVDVKNSQDMSMPSTKELNVVALCCTALHYVALCLGDIFHYIKVPLQFEWVTVRSQVTMVSFTAVMIFTL